MSASGYYTRRASSGDSSYLSPLSPTNTHNGVSETRSTFSTAPQSTSGKRSTPQVMSASTSSVERESFTEGVSDESYRSETRTYASYSSGSKSATAPSRSHAVTTEQLAHSFDGGEDGAFGADDEVARRNDALARAVAARNAAVASAIRQRDDAFAAALMRRDIAATEAARGRMSGS